MTSASGITYGEAFLPGLVIAALAIAILPWLNRDNPIIRGCAIILCIFFFWHYLLWRVFQTMPPAGLTWDFAAGVIFMAVEALSIIGSTTLLIVLTRTRSRSGEADDNQIWLKGLPRPPKVDVLICTYNEDETILERTIIGAQAIVYANYRVWVCDDGGRPWLEALCKRHGCGYLTRPDNAHAKAGNINNALRHLGALPEPPDFISILDADFVAKPQFLTRALSLMREADVGVVQTPQHFFNRDPIQSNLSIASVWPDEQRFFFDVLMPSYDAWGAPFCCGTSSVLRFAPLIEIGGIPTDSVTEDYLVSLRLREIGYRTVYLNEALSVGLAPEGLKEYIIQRSRWALGFVQICLGRSGPLSLSSSLPPIYRVFLIKTFLHWSATYLFRLLALIVPAIYLLFDIQAVYANVTDAIFYVFPYVVTQIVIVTWISRARVLPLMSDLSQLLCAHEILKSVAMGLVKPNGHKFRVTAKGGYRNASFVEWQLLRRFLLYLGLAAASILWAFTLDDARPLTDTSAMALFWSWYNIIVLVLACFVCVEAAQRRYGERFAGRDQWAFISTCGQELQRRVCDISVSGIRLSGKPPGEVGAPIAVRLNGIDIDATIINVYEDSFAAKFISSPHARGDLIRHLYCGDYSAAVDSIRPARVATAVINRLFR